MRIISRITAGVVLCAALFIAPRTAHAYSLSGVSAGADIALGGPSGFALSIGLDRLELDFIVGLSLNLPEGGVLEPAFAGAAGLFYTLADGDSTNFQIGGRVGVLVVGANGAGFGGPSLTTNAGISLEFDARVEHRLDDHCAINLQVGLMMQIWPDDPDAGTAQADFVFGFGNTGLIGGAGFRYWFDGLGGGQGATAAPVTSGTTTAPPPVQTQTQTQTQTTGTGETPYWEQ